MESMHIHGCVKLANDPGLIDLTTEAFGNVLTPRQPKGAAGARQVFGDNEHANPHEAARKGASADLAVCAYNDWLISTMNTRCHDEQAARAGDGMPDPRPCAVNSYSGGPVGDENDVRDDIDQWLDCYY